jgi:predicted RNA binding protein YcfA (HicA-like mRNA interferase family)
MAVLNSKEIEKALKKKGFTLNESSDHRRLELWYEDKFVLATKVSHNGQDIDDGLIGQMAKQIKLNKKDFLDLVKCPLSSEAYLNKLSEQDLLR